MGKKIVKQLFKLLLVFTLVFTLVVGTNITHVKAYTGDSFELHNRTGINISYSWGSSLPSFVNDFGYEDIHPYYTIQISDPKKWRIIRHVPLGTTAYNVVYGDINWNTLLEAELEVVTGAVGKGVKKFNRNIVDKAAELLDHYEEGYAYKDFNNVTTFYDNILSKDGETKDVEELITKWYQVNQGDIDVESKTISMVAYAIGSTYRQFDTKESWEMLIPPFDTRFITGGFGSQFVLMDDKIQLYHLTSVGEGAKYKENNKLSIYLRSYSKTLKPKNAPELRMMVHDLYNLIENKGKGYRVQTPYGDYAQNLYWDYVTTEIDMQMSEMLNNMEKRSTPVEQPTTNTDTPEISEPTYDYLETGDRGQRVVKVQQQLNLVGYPLVVDGVYGPNTRNKVKEFQGDHSLSDDGVIGPNTEDKLNLLSKKAPYDQISKAKSLMKANDTRLESIQLLSKLSQYPNVPNDVQVEAKKLLAEIKKSSRYGEAEWYYKEGNYLNALIISEEAMEYGYQTEEALNFAEKAARKVLSEAYKLNENGENKAALKLFERVEENSTYLNAIQEEAKRAIKTIYEGSSLGEAKWYYNNEDYTNALRLGDKAIQYGFDTDESRAFIDKAAQRVLDKAYKVNENGQKAQALNLFKFVEHYTEVTEKIREEASGGVRTIREGSKIGEATWYFEQGNYVNALKMSDATIEYGYDTKETRELANQSARKLLDQAYQLNKDGKRNEGLNKINFILEYTILSAPIQEEAEKALKAIKEGSTFGEAEWYYEQENFINALLLSQEAIQYGYDTKESRDLANQAGRQLLDQAQQLKADGSIKEALKSFEMLEGYSILENSLHQEIGLAIKTIREDSKVGEATWYFEKGDYTNGLILSDEAIEYGYDTEESRNLANKSAEKLLNEAYHLNSSGETKKALDLFGFLKEYSSIAENLQQEINDAIQTIRRESRIGEAKWYFENGNFINGLILSDDAVEYGYDTKESRDLINQSARKLLDEAAQLSTDKKPKEALELLELIESQEYVPAALLEETKESVQSTLAASKVMDHSEAVDQNKTWTIKFNKELDVSDLKKAGIKVLDQDGIGVEVAITKGKNGEIVVHPPESGYEKGTEYKLMISSEITTYGLKEPVIFTFKIN
ncbi:hypothetical protein N780_09405 [Pontibacillus chungwhensis BH030062]|uniref:Peptidoglycan binding-like domain-containing protein n=1 Tax=Pontibacillus chungwhensis BH030062 TaxID=1385513 RepID=A0A0A2UTR1_9BACI|nr:peptidoglycan-binding protein [Pontibacillus chungwhensis]KGP89846.1 hypothetical protein N780_09405 [Pontibacillus chungwhensis BH030062]